MKKKNHPVHFGIWIEVRKRFRLSDCQIQMARELGLNPEKFGSLGANPHEPWKAPLGQFIEEIYEKKFKRERPAVVVSIEQLIEPQEPKWQKRRKSKLAQAKEELQLETET